MKLSVALLVVAVAAPALAQAPRGASSDELMSQAEHKQKEGDLDGAVELLRKAVALPLASGEPALRLGRLLETRNEIDDAMDAYKAAAAKLPAAGKGEALGRLAILQELRGIAEAPATAEAAVAPDAEGLWPTIALSHRRAHQGQAAEATALAEKAQAAGGGAAASAALGHAREAAGDLPGAEAAHRAALASEATRLDAIIGLARVLRGTGRAAEAEPMLQQAIAAAPGAVEAYMESARVKLALNRPGDAQADAAIAAALAEGEPEADLLLQEVNVAKALAQIGSGQAELAVQDLTALRDQKPEVAEIRVGLARALVARRQLDAAVAELQKAVELKPGLAEAQYQLGYVQYALKGNAAAALGPLEQAVALAPGNVEYRTSYGAALSDAKQTERAVAELVKVTETPGYSRADAFIYLGRAHLNAKRYREAAAPLERAVSLAPSSADAWASLAWAYFGLKDADNFKRAAGKARSLGYKEATLLQYLTRVEGGEAIK